ncbi:MULTISPECIES: DUF2878 domain-containing protein [unclassified Pseudomonas]|uniref:DUF2878 domain-containing protein n=1 Tax=unclassified Pseudomonas TaxID=196821 RepID=UPI002AC8965D|nr:MULTISPECIES: DUF2878 domain-containing protein [unclassified Pseudomonas]MEB0041182.1 DUF2878 domain-containing protein [Pseudomonas sp. MH10]MEB0122768.1 DUF2878 domain-containing protein [Pseudomonas sp. CCI1.2]WPX66317.1 DUF2878 domain-containing protein [Pseudomonas sp. MH10]
MPKRLANALLFQIGWFACVLGADSLWLLLAGGALAVHLLWISSWRAEGPLILGVALIGTLIDSLLLKAGVFSFATDGPLIPPWLMVLWAVLAITLNHCLNWTAKPWWRASVLGAIGGPMSYYAGSQMAGVELPLGLWPSMLLLGVIWAVLFPLLQKLAKICKHRV